MLLLGNKPTDKQPPLINLVSKRADCLFPITDTFILLTCKYKQNTLQVEQLELNIMWNIHQKICPNN